MDNGYILIISEEPKFLVEKVNERIQEGFVPIGALVVYGCKLMQPMTLRVNQEINVNAQVQSV